MLKSDSNNSIVSLGTSDKHMRVVERLKPNNDENSLSNENDSNAKQMINKSELSDYSDNNSSVESKFETKSISSKKSSLKSVNIDKNARIKNISKLSKKSITTVSSLKDDDEEFDQKKSFYLLEQAIYNNRNNEEKVENFDRKTNHKKRSFSLRKRSDFDKIEDINAERVKSRADKTADSFKLSGTFERDELIIRSQKDLKQLNRSRLNRSINNKLAEFRDIDLNEDDNQKLKFSPYLQNEAPLITDLNPRYENTKTTLIRPPPPKPKPKPPVRLEIRPTLKSADMFEKRKEEIEERNKQEQDEKNFMQAQLSKSFTKDEEAKSVQRLAKIPVRLNLIENEFNKMKTIHDDPKLKNIDVNALSLRLYKVKKPKSATNENRPLGKIKTDKEIEQIYNRLFNEKKIFGVTDSMRTIKNSSFKNNDLVNSYTWRGYN